MPSKEQPIREQKWVPVGAAWERYSPKMGGRFWSGTFNWRLMIKVLQHIGPRCGSKTVSWNTIKNFTKRQPPNFICITFWGTSDTDSSGLRPKGAKKYTRVKWTKEERNG